jgi:hypothetical protein
MRCCGVLHIDTIKSLGFKIAGLKNVGTPGKSLM